MVAIVILNWNGWRDTVECLESLYGQSYRDFSIVVADNCSSDDSLVEIDAWLRDKGVKYHAVKEGESLNDSVEAGECILYSLKENYGFAKGNNMAVALIEKFECQYYLCLNNDTVVEPDFLGKLVEFQKLHNEFKVLTPQIRYNSDRELIWNCGGKLFAGFRKYFYAKANVSTLPTKEYLPITFVTGCALFITKDVLVAGKVFIERFFFGEEDFEFCIRQKRAKTKMACLLTSVIYHKVSATSTNETRLGRLFVHYLNRFINVRQNYSPLYYRFWSCFNLIYIKLRILRSHSTEEKNRILALLKQESRVNDSVSHEMFDHYCELFS